MQVTPYLNYEGRCDEALEFYKKALGAKVDMLMRFKDNPEPPPAGMQTPGTENKVMHCSFQIGDTMVMASDGRCRGGATFQGIMLNLSVESTADAQRYFQALSEGGTVQMPLTRTFYSPSFGMLVDRFGVNWMVYVVQK